MTFVLWCLAVMGVLGAAFGIGLAIASRVFHVEADPRVEEVAGALPSINCGACGYAGCDDYARAVVKGEQPNLCVPGGHETALKVAHIMGLTLADESLPVRAVVHCQGSTERCGRRFEYDGLASCAAAQLLQAGEKDCLYGCLGYGDCARVCPFDAITVDEGRIPVINWDRCTGCGACVRACPRNLIETLPNNIPWYVACSSQDKGKAVKDVCQVGCIACWICVKQSGEACIEKNGNLPRLKYGKECDYAKAAEKCPMHCFVPVTPPLVSVRAPAAKEAAAAAAG